MKITNYKIFNTQEISFENVIEHELNEVLNNADYSILENKPATNIKKYLIKEFQKNYWLSNNKLFFNSSRKVDLLKDNIGLQIQFGNHAQVWFDVLKLNYLFENKRITNGIILCLNKEISDQEWDDFVYNRKSLRGKHLELWQHISGCRQWIKVERDTATHEIFKTFKADEEIA